MKNLTNKDAYLKGMKAELKKVETGAKSISDMEKRLKFMHDRRQKKPDIMEIVYELYRLIPDRITLINFTYEADKQAVLRGQAPELNQSL